MNKKPLTYCCDSIKLHLEQYFKEPNSVDSVIKYVAPFDEYGIPISDGGSSFIHVNYCPWCGAKLPPSKRDEWFKRLEDLGYESPLTDEVPEAFKSSDWYRQS
jgi:hypothetical protein